LNNKAIIVALFKANGKITEALSQGLKPLGISIQQFNVLRILRGQKGNPSNLNTVHERMIHKMSNTTRLIDKLIDKGLVSRNLCKENRRKIELFITTEGLKLLEIVDPIVDQIEAQFIEALTSKQREEIIEILNNLNNNNENEKNN
jgi:DNA-binding MarR family transcriptional regulator